MAYKDQRIRPQHATQGEEAEYGSHQDVVHQQSR
jgi:hypothetical protein